MSDDKYLTDEQRRWEEMSPREQILETVKGLVWSVHAEFCGPECQPYGVCVEQEAAEVAELLDAVVYEAVEAEGKSWQETVENLLDRAERAEAAVAAAEQRERERILNDWSLGQMQGNSNGEWILNVVRQKNFERGVKAARDAVEAAAQSGAYIDYVEIDSALAAIDGVRP